MGQDFDAIITDPEIHIQAERESSILLIDDDPFLVDLVRDFLADYGFEFLSASGGLQGLRLADKKQPDLILLDLNMPRVDGFEVCATLKSNPQTSHIPVIFFSSDDSAQKKLRGFQLGAVDYIGKPVAMEELLARVTVHLKQHLTLRNMERRLEAIYAKYVEAPEVDEPDDAGEELPAHRAEKVRQAREYLENCVKFSPSLEELCATLALNPKRLSKDFQAVYGMTVFGWLREHRLQRSAELLGTTDLPVAVIADQLGFSAAANLSKAFRKRFNLTPRQFRASKGR